MQKGTQLIDSEGRTVTLLKNVNEGDLLSADSIKCDPPAKAGERVPSWVMELLCNSA